MRGKYRIRVQNRMLRYDFEIKRNITIIKGDSATGKTTLVDMIREYYENGADSGVELICDVTCGVLEGRGWKAQLASFHNSILFIDEGNSFVTSQEFAEAVQGSGNYFVIVTRENLAMLPYSVTEIYGIRDSGKYGTLKRTYNEWYQIYGEMKQTEEFRPDKVVTEDSHSGFQFFASVCDRAGVECSFAGGKSKILSYLLKENTGKVLVVGDGAAIGSEMDKLVKFTHIHPNIALYLPESFEWLILRSGVLQDGEVKAMLEEPENYIESEKFFSWERFFTSILIQKTRGTYLAYTKDQLNPAYQNTNIAEKILAVMEKIDLSNSERKI